MHVSPFSFLFDAPSLITSLPPRQDSKPKSEPKLPLSEATAYELTKWQALLKKINFYYDGINWHLDKGQIVSDSIPADQIDKFSDNLIASLNRQGYDAENLLKKDNKVRVALNTDSLSVLFSEKTSQKQTIEDHISSLLIKKLANPSEREKFNKIGYKPAIDANYLKKLPKNEKFQFYKKLYENKIITESDFFSVLQNKYGHSSQEIKKLLPKEDEEKQGFTEYLAYWWAEVGYSADITLQGIGTAPQVLDNFAAYGYPAVGVLDFCLTFKSLLEQLYGKDLSLKNLTEALTDNAYILLPLIFITQSFLPAASQVMPLTLSSIAGSMSAHSSTLSNSSAFNSITGQAGLTLSYLGLAYIVGAIHTHRVNNKNQQKNKQEYYLHRDLMLDELSELMVKYTSTDEKPKKAEIEARIRDLQNNLAKKATELQIESSSGRLEDWVSFLELSSYAFSYLAAPAILGSAIASGIRLAAISHGMDMISKTAHQNHGIIESTDEKPKPTGAEPTVIQAKRSQDLSEIVRKFKAASAVVLHLPGKLVPFTHKEGSVVDLEKAGDFTQLKNAISTLKYNISFLKRLFDRLAIEYPDQPQPKIVNLESLQLMLRLYALEIIKRIDNYVVSHGAGEKSAELLGKKTEIQDYLAKSLKPGASTVLDYRQKEFHKKDQQKDQPQITQPVKIDSSKEFKTLFTRAEHAIVMTPNRNHFGLGKDGSIERDVVRSIERRIPAKNTGASGIHILPYREITLAMVDSIKSFSALKDYAEGLKTELQWLNQLLIRLPQTRPGAKVTNLNPLIIFYQEKLKLLQGRLIELRAQQNLGADSYRVRFYRFSGIKLSDFEKASSEISKIADQIDRLNPYKKLLNQHTAVSFWSPKKPSALHSSELQLAVRRI